MNIDCIIPARFGSTRLPGKPLADINGRPMIQYVYERACQAKLIRQVFVATDHEAIVKAVRDFGGQAVLTSPDHPTGTDRLAEVARDHTDADILINVQGDEPLIDPLVIDNLAKAMVAEPQPPMATVKTVMAETDYTNPAAVKVVTDLKGKALYFSRSLIPFGRVVGPHYKVYKHLGIYAYKRDFLLQYAKLSPTPLEQSESLEQLRALEHGFAIQVIETDSVSVGVDTPEDLEQVRHILQQEGKA